jgi:hypothetical protein
VDFQQSSVMLYMFTTLLNVMGCMGDSVTDTHTARGAGILP